MKISSLAASFFTHLATSDAYTRGFAREEKTWVILGFANDSVAKPIKQFYL